jgi:hypothetical protein
MSRRASPLTLIDEAVYLLATGEHGIRQRLLAAYAQKLQHISAAELPAELAPLLTAIRRQFGQGSEAVARQAVEAMTPAQAVRLARRIVTLNTVFAGALYH